MRAGMSSMVFSLQNKTRQKLKPKKTKTFLALLVVARIRHLVCLDSAAHTPFSKQSQALSQLEEN